MVAPALNDVLSGLIRGDGACPPAIGQHEQPGATVVRVKLTAQVVALHGVLHQPGCRLLGDPG